MKPGDLVMDKLTGDIGIIFEMGKYDAPQLKMWASLNLVTVFILKENIASEYVISRLEVLSASSTKDSRRDCKEDERNI